MAYFRYNEEIPKREAEYTYADLNLTFVNHPSRNDIVPLYDSEAVKQAIKNTILTNKGERPFLPEFGGNVFVYLFENEPEELSYTLKVRIRDILAEHEPRAKDIRVITSNKINDDLSFEVSVFFSIENGGTPEGQEEVLEFALTRTR
jgi:phage baseplate assembly protein W